MAVEFRAGDLGRGNLGRTFSSWKSRAGFKSLKKLK